MYESKASQCQLLGRQMVVQVMNRECNKVKWWHMASRWQQQGGVSKRRQISEEKKDSPSKIITLLLPLPLLSFVIALQAMLQTLSNPTARTFMHILVWPQRDTPSCVSLRCARGIKLTKHDLVIEGQWIEVWALLKLLQNCFDSVAVALKMLCQVVVQEFSLDQVVFNSLPFMQIVSFGRRG